MKTEGEKNDLLLNVALQLGYQWLDKKDGDIGTVWVGHRWCDGSQQESRPHHAYLVVFESDMAKEIIPISFCPMDAITTKETRLQHCFDYAEAHFGVKYAETTLH